MHRVYSVPAPNSLWLSVQRVNMVRYKSKYYTTQLKIKNVAISIFIPEENMLL